MTYTRVNWQDAPSTATPLDAALLNQMDAGIAAAVPLDGSAAMTGQLQATAVAKLVTGHQETGYVGAYFVAASSTDKIGAGKSFNTVMTNVPTSVTLTVTGSTNVTSFTASQISVYGFLYVLSAAAAGTSDWFGTYTTVGNCLLAVDAQAQTFDHHCDGCGTVRRGLPLSALLVSVEEGARHHVILGYHCPCGTSEHFNARLTAADEADATPQGAGAYATTRGAQAALIRALMRAAGLPLIDGGDGTAIAAMPAQAATAQAAPRQRTPRKPRAKRTVKAGA